MNAIKINVSRIYLSSIEDKIREHVKISIYMISPIFQSQGNKKLIKYSHILLNPIVMGRTHFNFLENVTYQD